jgi:spore coat protein CotF
MAHDYLDVRNAEGMPNLADGTIALQFLMNAKTGVRNAAIALTEAATPEVRLAMRTQLENALNLHEEIELLMVKKGWLFPHDLDSQYDLDMKSSMMALQIAGLELFPGNTSKLGNFATPDK